MSTLLRNVSLDHRICVPRPSNWSCNRLFSGRLTSMLRTPQHVSRSTPRKRHLSRIMSHPFRHCQAFILVTGACHWAWIARRARIPLWCLAASWPCFFWGQRVASTSSSGGSWHRLELRVLCMKHLSKTGHRSIDHCIEDPLALTSTLYVLETWRSS
jgi:hypothetical protein